MTAARLRCDVVAVGTELLLGQIVDTNSAWIGEQLALSGIDTLVQVKVGDNHDRIVGQFRRLLADADALVVCGGLGPTHDDVTREAIAALMGVELVYDPIVGGVIRDLFAVRGRTMSDNNLRQAMVPVGATVIPQTRGTAPGLICPLTIDGVDKVIFAVPGVPYEMREMVDRAVIPELRRRSGDPSVIVSRVIRTWGESESRLNERLDGLIAELDSHQPTAPTLAFLASGWEGIKVRLTLRAADYVTAEHELDRWESRIRAELGDIVFGVDTLSADALGVGGERALPASMEAVVLELMRQRGWSLGTAESVTGGLVAARLTGVAGSSDVFRGSIVSYASDVKFDVLDVPVGPVITEACALEMAHGAQRLLKADAVVALTGIGGPGLQEGLPAGTLCVGVVWPFGAITRTLRLPGDREQMRQYSVISSLDLVRRAALGLL